MMGCWVYEPPAFASLRVPLLLTQKGEGAGHRPAPTAEGGNPAVPGIPRSRYFVCSRPFHRAKRAVVLAGYFLDDVY